MPRMSTDIPSAAPSQVIAGDTAKWRRELADYPASAGWELKYTIVGSAGAQNFSATADGDAFDVTVPAATTAGWNAGLYVLTEYVTNGTERYTIGTSNLVVQADLGAATTAVDTRSFARKALDNIEAYLAGGNATAAAMEFNGRKLSSYPITDLYAIRDRLRAEVSRESAATTGPIGRVLARI